MYSNSGVFQCTDLRTVLLASQTLQFARDLSLEAAVLKTNFSLCLHYQQLAILTWASNSKQWREEEMIDYMSLRLKKHLLVNKLQSDSRKK